MKKRAIKKEVPPDAPKLCESCAAIVASSKLEWVHCGGMSIGLYKQPMVWRLRDEYSSDVIKVNAQYAQRLARAARLIASVRKYVHATGGGDDIDDKERDEMLARIDSYFSAATTNETEK